MTSEPEAMQWKPDDQGGGTVEVIVAWVNANGGEARYENDPPEGALADDLVSRARVREAYLRRGTYARILIKQRDGSEAVCLPGQWVVKGKRYDPLDRSPTPLLDFKTACEFTVEDR